MTVLNPTGSPADAPRAEAELLDSGAALDCDAETTIAQARDRPTRLLRMVIWAIFSIVFTACIIQYILRYGRLVFYPTYDDVGYLCDGIDRLRTLADSGMAGFLKSFLKETHSPYAAFIATLGFAVFGPHDWAPYATNALLIFIYLLTVDYLMRGAKLWQRITVAIFALTIPAAGMAVFDFRPDHAVGLVTAIGVVLLVRNPLLTSSLRHKVAVGAVFGAALMVKPAVFPLTCVMFGVSLVLATAVDLVGARVRPLPRARILPNNRQTPPSGSTASQPQPVTLSYQEAGATTSPIVDDALSKWDWLRLVGGAWLACIIPAVLIAGPYFLRWGTHLYHYIVINLYGEQKALWAIHATPWQHAKWYITGDGGVVMLGQQLPVMLAVLLLGTIAVLLSRRRVAIARLVAMGLAWLAAYLPPTVTPNKAYPFGAVMTYLMVFFSVAAIDYLIVTVPARLSRAAGPADEDANRPSRANLVNRWIPQSLATLLIVGLCLISVSRFRWPGKFDEPNGRLQLTRQIGDAVYGALKNARVSGEMTSMIVPARVGTPNVFCNFTGTLNTATLSYFAQRDALDMEFSALEYAADIGKVEQAYDNVDFILAAEPGNSEATESMPSSKILAETVQLARQRPDFELIATIPTRGPGNFLLFRKRWPFTGWLPAKGFKNSGEKPAPLTWWGQGERSVANIQPPTGHVMFAYSAKPLTADQTVTVLIDGKMIHEQSMPDVNQFYDVRLPLAIPMAKGQHELEFRYAKVPERGAQNARTVEFRTLQVIPQMLGGAVMNTVDGATTRPGPTTAPSEAGTTATQPAAATEPATQRAEP